MVKDEVKDGEGCKIILHPSVCNDLWGDVADQRGLIVMKLTVSMDCCKEWFCTNIMPLNKEATTEIFPVMLILPGANVVSVCFNPKTGSCDISHWLGQEEIIRMLGYPGPDVPCVDDVEGTPGIYFFEGDKIKGSGRRRKK